MRTDRDLVVLVAAGRQEPARSKQRAREFRALLHVHALCRETLFMLTLVSDPRTG
jgi:hypothetical protein